MNLFDRLVNQALKNLPNFTALRIVVEKELLHHDILRILSQHDFLNQLTFIGGTCLRKCYGGTRLSEDLDFTGGGDFSRTSLMTMGHVLIDNLHEKYGLQVTVSEPEKEKNNVATWKIKIITRPQQSHLPTQRINLDICAVPSYDKKPMLLVNPYHVDMGTNGLIIQCQSREEIYTDKLLAFALRPNRIKYRDIWDILWLHQHGLKPRFDLIQNKLDDRQLKTNYFLSHFAQRKQLVTHEKQIATDFRKEMQRFLPLIELDKLTNQDGFWKLIANLIGDLEEQIRRQLA